MPEISIQENLLEKTIKQTDECVRCGLCLPHCPTYKLKLDERYSPRGRIMMLNNWAKEKIELKSADSYLSTCLNCLICEQVCPAKVDYGSLINTFQQQKNQNFKDKKQTSITYFLTNAWSNQTILILSRIAKLLQLSKLARFLKPSFLKTALISVELIGFGFIRQRMSKKVTSGEKTIYLSSLCISNLFEQTLLKASEKLLQRFHIRYQRIEKFSCCGALDYHQGHIELAQKKMAQFEKNFIHKTNSTILVTSSGCLAHLKSAEFKKLRKVSNQNDDTQSLHYQSVTDFLTQLLREKNLKFKKWQKGKVLLHLACTQRYPLNSKKILSLFEKIENLDLKIIDWGCCGSAGSYSFTHPKESNQLAGQFITQIEDKFQLKLNQVNYLLTTNTGCKVQLYSKLHQNKSLKMMHPIEFLADLII